MADETIVMDAGPLILLAKIDALSILEKLNLNFVAPTVVQKELAAGPRFGHPQVNVPRLTIHAVSEPVPSYIKATLDDGEAAVIWLALERGFKHVCLDDRRGRRMAKALGLEVVGLLGLLVRAKRQGHITALRPYTANLLAVGARYTPGLITEVLQIAGE